MVSSSRPDGRPRSTPVSFLVVAGRFWLPTGAGAARVRDVAHTPWLALALTEGGPARHRAVLVEGPAAVVAAADLPGEVRRRAPALRVGGDWAAVWLCVDPQRLVSYASPGWSAGPGALTDPPRPGAGELSPAAARMGRVPHPYWPLFDLRVRTPRLELRLPTEAEELRLAALAARGIHPPEAMPFGIPWTDAPSPELERGALQWWWRQRAEWRPQRWWFTGAVFVAGEPVGVQDLWGVEFASLGTVETGSWLGRAHQGQGLGREMRAAILHLAFAGLGAVEALSGAWLDNAASLAVSRQLGYVENGEAWRLRRGRPARHQGLRLERAAWERQRRPDITIEGLEPCRSLFGAGPAAAPPG